jgi:uracil phosphoribosyltransferase
VSDAVRVLDHTAARMQMAILRDVDTPQDSFRRAARRLGIMLAIAALDDVPAADAVVETPLGPATERHPSVPIVAVPVLRSGLGLLDGVQDVIPGVRVGMIGLERDEETLEPSQYYRKAPDLEGAWILMLEPMLATGGSASAAVQALHAEGALGVTVLAVVATHQGIDRIAEENPGVRFVVGAVDPRLNDHGFIVPGLGDFGDRLYGTL